jgi:16S rRNA (cytosine967-C5)-methyltransferase
MLNFRDYHTLKILDSYSTSRLPLDLLIRNYLKTNKAIGSKDRNQICKNIYYIIRNLSFIDFHLDAPYTWEKRLDFLKRTPSYDLRKIPPHILHSIPKWLYDLLKDQYSDLELDSILSTSKNEAPLTIRVNTLKTSRTELAKELSSQFQIEFCKLSAQGIKFSKREPVTAHPLFKQGFFEIQDEASQLACELYIPQPGEHVLDYCSGAGGKSLAIAPYLNKKGILYVHDIRNAAIAEAKKRFERAGVHNVQFFDTSKPLPDALKHKCDFVVADVPCTGTGTLRRNPDLKWKLSQEELAKLICDQNLIFDEALSYLKPKGHILYSTCSILKSENQDQVAAFILRHPNLVKIKELVLLPEDNGHDGFYACLLYLDDKNRK